MITKNIFLIFFAGLLVTNCSSSTNKKTTPKLPVSKPDLVLEDSQWQLQILHGRRSLSDVPVSLYFADSKVNGSTGCNNYSGSYSKTRAGACRIRKITLTRKICQPSEVMQQERAFAAVLKDTAACDLADDQQQLFLKDKKGTVLAIFTPPQEAQVLQGTSWRATSFSDGQGGMIQLYDWTRPLTVKFDKNGQLSGSAGCNSYVAACRADFADLSFKFDMIKMTAKQCSPERIMTQEGQFMAALYSAVSYRIKDETLTLNDTADKPVVILKRQ
jgi:heat shock protein HslJ